MSTPSGVPQAPVSAGGVEGQAAVIGEVAKEMYSLRFDGSSFLHRTPSVNHGEKYTFSGWFKKGMISGGTIISAGNVSGSIYYHYMSYNERITNVHYPDSSGGMWLNTESLYRDLSAWIHIVWVVDCQNSEEKLKQRIFVNGLEIEKFVTATFPVTYSSRVGCINNSSYQNRIGGPVQGHTSYFNGYMSNLILIDEQALEPSSFGELISDVWRPSSYSGDYGVNGFHLDFDPDNMIYDSNGKLTQVKDASGNDNHWTAN